MSPSSPSRAHRAHPGSCSRMRLRRRIHAAAGSAWGELLHGESRWIRAAAESTWGEPPHGESRWIRAAVRAPAHSAAPRSFAPRAPTAPHRAARNGWPATPTARGRQGEGRGTPGLVGRGGEGRQEGGKGRGTRAGAGEEGVPVDGRDGEGASGWER